ncbi:MAG: universal stress protein, partial [Actinocatenispora sp.]
PRDPGDQQSAAEDALRAAVRDALGPDADPRHTAVRGRPATVLLDAAVEAQLLVLGAPRTLGATRRGLLVTTLAHRAHCPVVAMPVGEARRSRLSRITDSARGRP